jgi:hypothetical protein
MEDGPVSAKAYTGSAGAPIPGIISSPDRSPYARFSSVAVG